MEAKAFQSWLPQVSKLTERQRSQLKHTLERVPHEAAALDVINRRAAEMRACPHCHGGTVSRWGSAAGRQRYRCATCHRTFNAATGTPLAGLRRPDAWWVYAQAMLDGLSVRKAAKQAGVHRTTSFRWRHRFLQLPAEENDTELSSIVEADETYFLESFKGQRSLLRPARHRGGHASKRGLSAEQIPVLVVQDRQGKHYDAVLSKADTHTLGYLLPQLLAPSQYYVPMVPGYIAP